jgi:hypothetical protein
MEAFFLRRLSYCLSANMASQRDAEHEDVHLSLGVTDYRSLLI